MADKKPILKQIEDCERQAEVLAQFMSWFGHNIAHCEIDEHCMDSVVRAEIHQLWEFRIAVLTTLDSMETERAGLGLTLNRRGTDQWAIDKIRKLMNKE